MKGQTTQALQRRIVGVAIAGVWIAVIVVALLLSVPWYQRVKSDTEESLALIAQNRALSVKHHLYRYEHIAQSVSGRIHARQLLAKYQRGSITREALVEGSLPILKEAMRQSSEIAGIVRLASDASPLLAVGEAFSSERLIADANSASGIILLRIVTSEMGRPLLLVFSPILNHAGARLGTDLVAVYADDLTRLAAPQAMASGGLVDVLIAKGSPNDLQILPAAWGHASDMDALHAEFVRVLRRVDTSPELAVELEAGSAGTKNAIAYLQSAGGGWFVAAMADRSVLYGPLLRTLLLILGSMFGLTAAGTLVMWRVISPLAGRFVKRSEQLWRESEERFRALVESTSDWIWEADQSGVYTYASPKVYELLGYAPQEVIGKTPYDFMPLDEASRVAEKFREIVASKAPFHGLERISLHKDGHQVVLETSGVPVLNLQDELIGYRGVDRDVTLRKQAEEALQTYREHLEKLVGERTQALERSNRELESYSYSIAHDLRAPLRSIVSFSQIVLQDAGEVLDAEQVGNLQRVVAAGKHMTNLIDDILELSRITRSELHRGPVDLSKMTRQIASRLDSSQEDRRLDWRIADQVIAFGDQQLLTVAMENLVGNAWKYSSRRRDAYIEFGADVRNGQAVFFVRDNGVGFNMDHAGKLFQPFQRLHARSEFEGTGIGLATVQRVVQRHGGRVWAESKEGEGAAFYFTLGH